MTTLGFCKACRHPLAKDINKRLARGDTYPSVVDWCATKDFKVTRQLLARHKEHITDPRQTFVDHARANPTIKGNVSNDDFLQAVIDVSAQAVAANPEAITVAHGLKAVQIREGRRDKHVDIRILLAKAFTGNIETHNVEMIEGSYTELPEDSTLGSATEIHPT